MGTVMRQPQGANMFSRGGKSCRNLFSVWDLCMWGASSEGGEASFKLETALVLGDSISSHVRNLHYSVHQHAQTLSLQPGETEAMSRSETASYDTEKQS